MFDSLFGLPLAARFFIAFVVVLALIGITAWVVRRFGAARLGGGSARGRQPRLAVIDAATVDGRRRLVLIRRDNIEHLLMIGGPSDVVIEPNIVRAGAPREAGRIDTPPRDSARTTPAVDNGWPLQPINEPPAPAPVAPVAPAARAAFRAAAAEEPWTAPEPGARARPAENLSGLAAELSSRLAASELPPQALAPRPEPVAPRAEPTPAPVPRVTAVPPPPEPVAEPAGTHDQNLADMAHQLEAALRRTPDNRPPVTDPLAQARPAEVRAALREPKPRSEPSLEVKPEPRNEPKLDVKPEPLFEPKFKSESNVARLEPKLDIKPEPKPQAPAKGQDFYDNLEEEMASLLGRPSGKS
ncbi:MAG TPA: flagellar biosynthetic protein FliO [Pseudolabrys sp.]|jgi:flagellar protein FliO/FliZ|uniref:FliO/MopB family protein n=1 Tax=Pseudolabrys sp. TaxID=1960880 RepID=UPI002DDD18C4|nr:flagellar biosynthetic protein FliO [Pseudolabrys sp.]HEV2629041.1 flagellar biosynthetic protein FliO [Pseudolabrys sp.]